jgi:hypothetical protein
MSMIIHSHKVPYTSFSPNSRNLAVNGDAWTYSGDNGTKATIVANLDRAGGGFSLTMDGTDNDCETVYWGGETIDATSAGRCFGFQARMSLTEVDTDDADWFIGFSDTVGATFFADGDTLASMDAFGIYKITGSMFFRQCALNAGAQSGATTTTAFVSATEYKLNMDCVIGAAGIQAWFYVNDVLIGSKLSGITLTGTGLMHPVVALAADGAHAESIQVYEYIAYSHPSA